jgi:hypothetical protein
MLIYFLPAIILLGVITSYQDITTGKIRNRWVLIAIGYVVVAYSIIIPYTSATSGIDAHYVYETLTNAVFSVLAGFLLWYFGIWTAGDGKLFIAFSLLIPLSAYPYGYQEWVPSVVLLINMFIVSSVLLLFAIIVRTKWRKLLSILGDILRQLFMPLQLAMSAANLLVVSWAATAIISIMPGQSNALAVGILTLLLYATIQNALPRWAGYAFIGLSVIRLIVDHSTWTLAFWTTFTLILLVWRILIATISGSISRIGHELFTKEIEVKYLHEGINLAERIDEKKHMEKKEIQLLRRKQGVEIICRDKRYYVKRPMGLGIAGNFIGEEAEGLTSEQIARIKRIGFKTVRVSETLPFAPFLFAGTLATIIAKGNVLIRAMLILRQGV